MGTGLWMQGTGSGCLQVLSSTSSSGSTPPWPSARRRTRMETTSSKFAASERGSRRVEVQWWVWFDFLHTFLGSTFRSWRSSQLSTSMSPGKPHAVSSRLQAASLVKIIRSPLSSTRSSARRTSRGWRWPIPRDLLRPQSRQPNSKVMLKAWMCRTVVPKIKCNSNVTAVAQNNLFFFFFFNTSQVWSARDHPSWTWWINKGKLVKWMCSSVACRQLVSMFFTVLKFPKC